MHEESEFKEEYLLDDPDEAEAGLPDEEEPEDEEEVEVPVVEEEEEL